MRKFYIFLAVLVCNFVNSQNSIDLKFSYKPECKYDISVISDNSSSITYKGNKEILNAIKDQGIENPTKQTSKSFLNSTILTGKLAQNVFPIEIIYNKAETGEGEEIFPKNTRMLGTCKLDSFPKLDSIIGNKINSQTKKMIFEIINKSFSQLIVPNKNVKIGEEFIVKNPMTIPIGPTQMNMNLVSKYKLISIKENLGFFDITYDIEGDFKIESTPMEMKGSGTGKLIYNAKENIYSDYETDMNMSMSFETNGVTLDIKHNTHQKISTKIVK